MKPLLSCPRCSRPIAEAQRDVAHVFCPACQMQFGVLYGKISRRSSVHEAWLYLTQRLPKLYRRHYTLQIITADRVLKRLQFAIPGQLDGLPVHQGDVVSVLYTLQGYVMKNLVAITNHTTGKHYVLSQPVPNLSYALGVLGAMGAGWMLGAALLGINLWIASGLVGLGLGLALRFVTTAQLTTPSLETAGSQARRLLADQRLIAHQRKITQRLHELEHEYHANHALIEQLVKLKQKMHQVDAALYSARIYRATTAIRILKQQLANNQRLVREYQRTFKMIEIEVETSWIADQLPEVENFTRRIVERLSELRTIEDQNEVLKLQLSAYEEVQYDGIQDYESAGLSHLEDDLTGSVPPDTPRPPSSSLTHTN